jgi:hypothetical protein
VELDGITLREAVVNAASHRVRTACQPRRWSCVTELQLQRTASTANR